MRYIHCREDFLFISIAMGIICKDKKGKKKKKKVDSDGVVSAFG